MAHDAFQDSDDVLLGILHQQNAVVVQEQEGQDALGIVQRWKLNYFDAFATETAKVELKVEGAVIVEDKNIKSPSA